MSNKKTILLYGRSGSGKSTQIGQLCEYVYATLKLKTRLYTGDRGGIGPVEPYVQLGLMEIVQMGETDPFMFLNKAVRGYVRDDKGKWILPDNSSIGLFAFESLRAFAEALMDNMSTKAINGVNIGGGGNINFAVQGDGETLKVGGANMAMFGVAQSRMTSEVWESQKLNAPYILWTSSVSKDDDPNASGKVLGPDVIGKALTTEVPRWFDQTFRLDVIPAQSGKPERHILYLGSHVDVGAGNAAGLGNTRLPLDAPPLATNTIEPASVVKALELLAGGKDSAKEVIRKRLGL